MMPASTGTSYFSNRSRAWYSYRSTGNPPLDGQWGEAGRNLDVKIIDRRPAYRIQLGVFCPRAGHRACMRSSRSGGEGLQIRPRGAFDPRAVRLEARTEERRGGKGWGGTCRFRWSPYN